MTQKIQEIRNSMYLRIRTLRKKAHITQEQMAEYLCISRRTYANYERGIHAMPAEVLVCIADLLHTSLDYLTGRNVPVLESEERNDRTGMYWNYYRKNLQDRQP